ncbi:hypothetical protein S245_055340 [Arachis hypogaea]|nr:uncharacterized protein DS421_16g538560 [Arachis hypogaea]
MMNPNLLSPFIFRSYRSSRRCFSSPHATKLVLPTFLTASLIGNSSRNVYLLLFFSKSLIKQSRNRINVIRRKRNSAKKFLKRDSIDLLANHFQGDPWEWYEWTNCFWNFISEKPY